MAATLLTLAEMREHVETDIVDGALQRVMNSEEAEIDSRFGAIATQPDVLGGLGTDLFPSRPIQTVTGTITEILFDTFGNESSTDLNADDFKILNNGRTLKRLTTGTNPRQVWGHRIELTYVPLDETERRIGVLVDLVKLSLSNNGKKNEWSGDYRTEQKENYQRERERILSRLTNRRRNFA